MALALSATTELKIDGVEVVRKVSTDPAKAREVFESLALRFKWHKQVTNFIVDTMMIETLTEFINVFSAPPNCEVDKIWELCVKDVKEVDGVTPLKSRGVQGARVREAWTACLAAERLGQEIRTKGDVALDLDAMLKESELRSSRATFWGRHKVSFMPQFAPGDALMSRLTNELNKRCLNVADMLRTKGAEDEKRTRKTLRDIGKGTGLKIETGSDEVEVDRRQTSTDYFFGLTLYLYTLAVVGCTVPKGGVPKDAADADIAEEEESEPSDYIEFPYQFAIKYLDRATKYANKVPVSDSFRLLRQRDEEERSKWLHEFRRLKSKSLGKVVEKIYQDSDSLWRWESTEPGTERSRKSGQADVADGTVRQLEHTIKQLKENNLRLRDGGRTKRERSRSPRRREDKSSSKKAERGDKPSGQVKTNAQLKNGTVLCPAWNKGKCSKANCPDKHACNGQEQKDAARCCGGNHKSIDCRTPRRG